SVLVYTNLSDFTIKEHYTRFQPHSYLRMNSNDCVKTFVQNLNEMMNASNWKKQQSLITLEDIQVQEDFSNNSEEAHFWVEITHKSVAQENNNDYVYIRANQTNTETRLFQNHSHFTLKSILLHSHMIGFILQDNHAIDT